MEDCLQALFWTDVVVVNVNGIVAVVVVVGVGIFDVVAGGVLVKLLMWFFTVVSVFLTFSVIV